MTDPAESAPLVASVLAMAATCVLVLDRHAAAQREASDVPRMALDAVGRWADAGCLALPPAPPPGAPAAPSAARDAAAYWGDCMDLELRRPAALAGATEETRRAMVRMLDAARAATGLACLAPFGGASSRVVALGIRTALGAAAHSLTESRDCGPMEAWWRVLSTYAASGGSVAL